MNGDVEIYIRQKCPWSKLPPSIKQILAHSQKEYEKLVINLSVKNQLRFRGNLVRSVKKDERGYYEELLTYSKEHLMLYPYHLSDFIVTGMRVTPFQYYISIMQDLMEQEKSYDSLPNFTAADCLRLLGIGRNEYIELMNQCRSSKKFFGVRRKPIRDLLPPKPVPTLIIEPWWLVYVGYVTDEDIRVIPESEKVIIDKIIDNGALKAGELDLKHVIGLYRRGLIYLDVPIEDSDCVSVPPLEGFVMNRVLGDYLETLLYKIFVSIDEHTNVAELANVLQVDLELVKNAVSMYCRLGFARKKGQDDTSQLHSSWQKVSESDILGNSNGDLDSFVNYLLCENEIHVTKNPVIATHVQIGLASVQPSKRKRIGFLFDSTLTAFLMMGNLSQGLKTHAVTMFEVGKLSDESLDSFVGELLKVADAGEGEARRYFDHALTLRETILFLRQNPHLMSHYEDQSIGDTNGFGLDLLRCESLQNLDQETCSRLLNKNYCLLISMAPLTYEIRPVSSCYPPHLGPPIPEVSSIWLKLYLYALTKCGPPSLLLAKGTRLRFLPKIFKDQKKLLVTTWAHDPSAVPMSNALPILNDALCHSAVLVQGQGSIAEFSYVPFPFLKSTDLSQKTEQELASLEDHYAIKNLQKEINLKHSCGYITMMKTNNSAFLKAESNGIPLTSGTNDHDTNMQPCYSFSAEKTLNDIQFSPFLNAFEEHSTNSSFLRCLEDGSTSNKIDENQWTLLDCSFGIPLFDGVLNKQVCERLAKAQLCNKMSLKHMVNSNRKLCLSLLEFISEHQPVISSYESGRINSFSPDHPGSEFELPLPTANLMFSDGKLSIWNET